MSCNYHQMVSPQVYNSPVMQYPNESLENLYPDTYRIVYPKVKSMCMMVDHPGNPHMYPYPSKEAIESMTENIYNNTLAEMGYSDENGDLEQEDTRQFGFGPGFGYGPGFPGFGRRRFLRDLVSVLLIRELLGRRRPYPYYPYHYGY